MALISWLVAAYGGICAAAYFGNRLLMYIPDPTRITTAEAGLDSVREVEITVGDGLTLVAWHPGKTRQADHPLFPWQWSQAANRAPQSG